jgi:hypothetical protein
MEENKENPECPSQKEEVKKYEKQQEKAEEIDLEYPIFRVKRVKINKNLGTIDRFQPLLEIDFDVDYPISWESYRFNTKDNRFLFTKVYTREGKVFIVPMTPKEWKEIYLPFKAKYNIMSKLIEDKLIEEK